MSAHQIQYPDDVTGLAMAGGPDPYDIAVLDAQLGHLTETRRNTRCGHGVPFSQDCDGCDHENMMSDADRC